MWGLFFGLEWLVYEWNVKGFVIIIVGDVVCLGWEGELDEVVGIDVMVLLLKGR